MMHKWSSTKSTDHQTIRQRNNERRHRQRVKNHTADLESQLQQTQSRLDLALNRIAELESELALFKPGGHSACIPPEELTLHHGSLEVAHESEDDSYALLPPPPAGKSTSLCREAYITIAQHNHKGLDDAFIKRWLESGFHGSLHRGEGCRVDNGLLFRLLDSMISD